MAGERPTAELDELVLTVVVDNETDTLSSVDPDLPQRPELLSLLGRVAPSRRHEGHDAVPVFGHLCVACHGFSVLVSASAGDRRCTVLFDVGPYGDVWLANAERLGLDLSDIETVFLSHWHWDHSGGLPAVVAAISAARRAAGRRAPVVDVHPDRPDQRGILTPAGTVVLLPPEPDLADLERGGGVVVAHAEQHAVGGGLLLGSGLVERLTEYETGLPGHLSFRGEEATPDPLVLDERFLSARVRGRGVTVLTACSHAGVVNACLGAQEAYPGLPVDLVLGGYHLAGASVEGRTAATVHDLDARIGARVLAPGHCTGWRAKSALAQHFSPGRYAPSVVGSRYLLTG